ncbi:MAG: hypothetical protein QG628_1057 [Patescibacteria group bacterium]|jgi:hypothetical protein|nr:hypothetical protein [Patescibacteria group bacterium]
MGSYRDTQLALGVLNEGLRTRYDEGEPVRLDVHGRPKFHILSFDPLAYEKYGTFRNKAPYVAGSLALRAFLSQPHPDGSTIIIAGVEAGQEGYGFYMDFRHPNTAPTIQGVAQLLGTEITFTR